MLQMVGLEKGCGGQSWARTFNGVVYRSWRKIHVQRLKKILNGDLMGMRHVQQVPERRIKFSFFISSSVVLKDLSHLLRFDQSVFLVESHLHLIACPPQSTLEIVKRRFQRHFFEAFFVNSIIYSSIESIGRSIHSH